MVLLCVIQNLPSYPSELPRHRAKLDSRGSLSLPLLSLEP